MVAIYGGASMPQQVDALEKGARDRRRHARAASTISSAASTLKLDHCADGRAGRGRRDAVHGLLRGGDADPRRSCPRSGRRCSSRPPCRRTSSRSSRSYLSEPRDHPALRRRLHGRGHRERHLLHGRTPTPSRATCSTCSSGRSPTTAIIFCNTRDDTSLVTAVLNRNGYDAEYAQRRPAAEGARAGDGQGEGAARCGSWWPPTSPPAASTSPT